MPILFILHSRSKKYQRFSIIIIGSVDFIHSDFKIERKQYLLLNAYNL